MLPELTPSPFAALATDKQRQERLVQFCTICDGLNSLYVEALQADAKTKPFSDSILKAEDVDGAEIIEVGIDSELINRLLLQIAQKHRQAKELLEEFADTPEGLATKNRLRSYYRLKLAAASMQVEAWVMDLAFKELQAVKKREQHFLKTSYLQHLIRKEDIATIYDQRYRAELKEHRRYLKKHPLEADEENTPKIALFKAFSGCVVRKESLFDKVFHELASLYFKVGKASTPAEKRDVIARVLTEPSGAALYLRYFLLKDKDPGEESTTQCLPEDIDFILAYLSRMDDDKSLDALIEELRTKVAQRAGVLSNNEAAIIKLNERLNIEIKITAADLGRQESDRFSFPALVAQASLKVNATLPALLTHVGLPAFDYHHTAAPSMNRDNPLEDAINELIEKRLIDFGAVFLSRMYLALQDAGAPAKRIKNLLQFLTSPPKGCAVQDVREKLAPQLQSFFALIFRGIQKETYAPVVSYLTGLDFPHLFSVEFKEDGSVQLGLAEPGSVAALISVTIKQQEGRFLITDLKRIEEPSALSAGLQAEWDRITQQLLQDMVSSCRSPGFIRQHFSDQCLKINDLYHVASQANNDIKKDAAFDILLGVLRGEDERSLNYFVRHLDVNLLVELVKQNKISIFTLTKVFLTYQTQAEWLVKRGELLTALTRQVADKSVTVSLKRKPAILSDFSGTPEQLSALLTRDLLSRDLATSLKTQLINIVDEHVLAHGVLPVNEEPVNHTNTTFADGATYKDPPKGGLCFRVDPTALSISAPLSAAQSQVKSLLAKPYGDVTAVDHSQHIAQDLWRTDFEIKLPENQSLIWSRNPETKRRELVLQAAGQRLVFFTADSLENFKKTIDVFFDQIQAGVPMSPAIKAFFESVLFSQQAITSLPETYLLGLDDQVRPHLPSDFGALTLYPADVVRKIQIVTPTPYELGVDASAPGNKCFYHYTVKTSDRKPKVEQDELQPSTTALLDTLQLHVDRLQLNLGNMLEREKRLVFLRADAEAVIEKAGKGQYLDVRDLQAWRLIYQHEGNRAINHVDVPLISAQAKVEMLEQSFDLSQMLSKCFAHLDRSADIATLMAANKALSILINSAAAGNPVPIKAFVTALNISGVDGLVVIQEGVLDVLVRESDLLNVQQKAELMNILTPLAPTNAAPRPIQQTLVRSPALVSQIITRRDWRNPDFSGSRSVGHESYPGLTSGQMMRLTRFVAADHREATLRQALQASSVSYGKAARQFFVALLPWTNTRLTDAADTWRRRRDHNSKFDFDSLAQMLREHPNLATDIFADAEYRRALIQAPKKLATMLVDMVLTDENYQLPEVLRRQILAHRDVREALSGMPQSEQMTLAAVAPTFALQLQLPILNAVLQEKPYVTVEVGSSEESVFGIVSSQLGTTLLRNEHFMKYLFSPYGKDLLFQLDPKNIVQSPEVLKLFIACHKESDQLTWMTAELQRMAQVPDQLARSLSKLDGAEFAKIQPIVNEALRSSKAQASWIITFVTEASQTCFELLKPGISECLSAMDIDTLRQMQFSQGSAAAEMRRLCTEIIDAKVAAIAKEAVESIVDQVDKQAERHHQGDHHATIVAATVDSPLHHRRSSDASQRVPAADIARAAARAGGTAASGDAVVRVNDQAAFTDNPPVSEVKVR